MKTNQIILLVILLSLFSGLIGGSFSSYITKNINTDSVVSTTVTNEKILDMQNLESTIIGLAQDISPSVVSIVIKKDLPLFRDNPFGFYGRSVGSVETEIGGGTGFFVDSDGTILTNKHVVADTNAKYSVILNSGESYDAEVLAIDGINDLAIIKIDYESNPIEIISKNEDIQIGQFVIAIGNALSEFQNSVSFGVVSGKDRIITAQGEKLSSLIQTDTAINPGNSGGPLLNVKGEVIGINTAIASGQGLGFSIQLSKEKIQYMLNSIAENGEIQKPFIGIYYIPVNEAIADELGIAYDYGVYVPNENNSVISGSAADDAGIEKGDTVLSIDGKKITFENSLDIILQNKFPGEELELEVLKGSGKITNLILTLGEN